jgi:hypothetical protein
MCCQTHQQPHVARNSSWEGEEVPQLACLEAGGDLQQGQQSSIQKGWITTSGASIATASALHAGEMPLLCCVTAVRGWCGWELAASEHAADGS